MIKPQQNLLLPSLGLCLGGAMWGAIWIPLRAIGETGPQLAWPGLLIYACLTVLLMPLAIRNHREIRLNLWGMMSCGLLTGAAFSFYITSLFFTDVVRAILLFYITPVWGTVLGIVFLGERLTLWRVLALVSGLLGLVVVLGDGGAIPWPKNTGDWLALISGILWAVGTLQLNKYSGVPVRSQILGFVWGSLIVTAASVLIFGSAMGPVPSVDQITSAAPLVLATAFYALPMLFLTIWPARLLSPGRVGLLLMSEVVVAVITAFLFSGEPFGLPQAIGTALILSAALFEVAGPILSRAPKRVR
ncbi:DMT family transporter [Ruegeria sp. 2205SS24-7]|uniref:DMT family transporter n=1 Tax=Ruegeria discodermiae TaxID=3064389 RepID=UPI0027429A78|nr:DMT family transporter [Ruegeria sp. 2205SS24-7]MDP5216542.1 DMT family transporter [Ruegeria sp. 2205SS24-7]